MDGQHIKISGRVSVSAANRLREWVVDELNDLNELARLLLGPDPAGESFKAPPPAIAETHVVNGAPIDYPRVTAEPVGEPDPIEELVGRFADALRIKLKVAREKYGYTGTPEPWQETGWEDQLREQLREHVIKGDPLDVAAYAAFAWHHGWSTARQQAAPSYDPDRADADGDDAGDEVPVAPASSWTPDQVAQFNALTPEQARTLGRAAADITEIGREAGTPVEAAAPQPVHTNLPADDETRRRHGRQVIDLDSGERWASAPEAATVFGVNVVNIYKVCNGKQNSTAGRRLAWADAAPVPAAAPTETALPIERPAPSQPRKRKTKAVIDRDTGERWESAAIAAAALGLKDPVAVYNNIAGNSAKVAGRRLAWADAQPPVNGSAAKPPPDGLIDLPNGDLAEHEPADGPVATEPSSAPTPKPDFTARPIVDPNAPPAPINADAKYIPREVETQEEFDARRRREEREARRKAETFPAEGGA